MITAEKLEAEILSALMGEGHSASTRHTPNNARLYDCTIANCKNPAFAKGFCNAHYLRNRNGRPMDAPIRNRNRITKCRDCDKPLNGKGGWGLCSKHYRKRRRKIIQDTCISALGGKCGKCSGVFPSYVYDFHHRAGGDDKLFAIGNSYETISIKLFAEEIVKCDLLCSNCHRIVHHG